MAIKSLKNNSVCVRLQQFPLLYITACASPKITCPTSLYLTPNLNLSITVTSSLNEISTPSTADFWTDV
jgi:hypothetical protein